MWYRYFHFGKGSEYCFNHCPYVSQRLAAKLTFSGLNMALQGNIPPATLGMCQHAFSGPRAPPGNHQGTNMNVFAVCHHFQYRCWRWQTHSSIELSKLATFLIPLKGKKGPLAEATTKTQEGCHDIWCWEIIHYYVITSRKYFIIFPDYHLK